MTQTPTAHAFDAEKIQTAERAPLPPGYTLEFSQAEVGVHCPGGRTKWFESSKDAKDWAWEDSAQRIVMTDTPNQAMDKWKSIDTIPDEDGWVGRHLFALKQPWGWEMWVGQRDAGYPWLVRCGDGSCAETPPPTHWRPQPEPPAS